MPISKTNSSQKIIYNGSDTFSVFSIDGINNIYLEVYDTNENIKYASSFLTEGVDYTVTNLSPTTGNFDVNWISTTNTLAIDDIVLIYRQTPLTIEDQLNNNNLVIGTQRNIERLERQNQDLKNTINKCIKFNNIDDGFIIPTKENRKDRILYFNDISGELELVAPSRIQVDSSSLINDSLNSGNYATWSIDKLNSTLVEPVEYLKSARVDVTSFGAKGDGVTDDALAINNAINQAVTSGSRIVYIPDTQNGYAIGSPIIIPSNVILLGDNVKSCKNSRIKPIPNYTGYLVQSKNYQTEISLQSAIIGLFFDGSGTTLTGLRLSSQEFIISNCRFDNMYTYGIHSSGISSSLLSLNNTFKDLYFTRIEGQANFYTCIFEDYYSADNKLFNTYTEGGQLASIETRGQNLICTNNHFYLSKHAILSLESSEKIITNNYIEHMTDSPIYINSGSSSDLTLQFDISHNEFRNVNISGLGDSVIKLVGNNLKDSIIAFNRIKRDQGTSYTVDYFVKTENSVSNIDVKNNNFSSDVVLISESNILISNSSSINNITYSVNSAKTTNGYADFITKVNNNTISFDLSENIIYTDSESVTNTINQISNITGLQEGTSIIIYETKNNLITFINTNNNTVSEGIILPAGVNGDYFLDISKKPYKGYKKISGSWVNTAFVKLGEVTITSGIMSTPISYALNGEYISPLTSISYNFSFNHNIGTSPSLIDENVLVINETPELGYAKGDVLGGPMFYNASQYAITIFLSPIKFRILRNKASLVISSSSSNSLKFGILGNRTQPDPAASNTLAPTFITDANWRFLGKYKRSF